MGLDVADSERHDEAVSSQPCRDCPRQCPTRGPRSFCGVDRPGRVYWRGVTMLEEHELAPTYEVYFTGCSLRCRFCTVPEAIYAPREGTWMPPGDLVDSIAADDVPPFRTISLVGGDPTVNLPYVRELLPILRSRFPQTPLVLNTNLFIPPALARWCAEAFDWIVGDVHFWEADCSREIAASSDYPAAATAAAEAILAAGGRLIARILALPGHTDCCTAPTAAWAAGLRGDVRVHLMTHYAPAGRARGHAQLGRRLTE
jgi:putative pyruvate formate lyase activating enzyme